MSFKSITRSKLLLSNHCFRYGIKSFNVLNVDRFNQQLIQIRNFNTGLKQHQQHFNHHHQQSQSQSKSLYHYQSLNVLKVNKRFLSCSSPVLNQSPSETNPKETNDTTVKSKENDFISTKLNDLVDKKAVVENSGSTARDHLANERTFLAWLRTSLVCVTLSIPLHELGLLSPAPLTQFTGAGALVLSIGVLTFATRRYFLNAYLLQNGYFHYNRRGVMIISSVAFLVACSLLAVVAAAEGKSLLPAGIIVTAAKESSASDKECNENKENKK
jgi:uncharacterized membrane protein YidH (DUF202 family)